MSVGSPLQTKHDSILEDLIKEIPFVMSLLEAYAVLRKFLDTYKLILS